MSVTIKNNQNTIKVDDITVGNGNKISNSVISGGNVQISAGGCINLGSGLSVGSNVINGHCGYGEVSRCAINGKRIEFKGNMLYVAGELVSRYLPRSYNYSVIMSDGIKIYVDNRLYYDNGTTYQFGENPTLEDVHEGQKSYCDFDKATSDMLQRLSDAIAENKQIMSVSKTINQQVDELTSKAKEYKEQKSLYVLPADDVWNDDKVIENLNRLLDDATEQLEIKKLNGYKGVYCKLIPEWKLRVKESNNGRDLSKSEIDLITNKLDRFLVVEARKAAEKEIAEKDIKEDVVAEFEEYKNKKNSKKSFWRKLFGRGL